MTLERGEVVGGRFEVERPLASDFGYAVYRARNLMTGKPVALKVLARVKTLWADPFVGVLGDLQPDDPDAGMVACVGEGPSGRSARFFAFEWTTGDTLADRLPTPVDRSEVLAIGAALAESLAELHARGVGHGSIRPSRVVFSKRGPRLRDPVVPPSHRALPVNAAYLAPEMIATDDEAPPTPEADVYALGALLHHAATGSPPQQSSTVLGVFLAALFAPPAAPPASLGALGPWLARMTAPEPFERPRAERIADTLRSLRDGSASGSLPPPSSSLVRTRSYTSLGGLLLVRGLGDAYDPWQDDMRLRGGDATRLVDGTAVARFELSSQLAARLLEAAHATRAHAARASIVAGAIDVAQRSSSIGALAQRLAATPAGATSLEGGLGEGARPARAGRGGTVRGTVASPGSARSTPKLGVPATDPPPSPRMGKRGTLVIEPELKRGGTVEIEVEGPHSDNRPTLESLDGPSPPVSSPTCEIQIEPSEHPTLEIEVDEKLIERSRPSTQGKVASKTARGAVRKPS